MAIRKFKIVTFVLILAICTLVLAMTYYSMAGTETLSKTGGISNSVNVIKSFLKPDRINSNDKPTVKMCTYYVVFDAVNTKKERKVRSLSFLEDNQPPGWCILVINLDDQSLQSSCKNCVLLQKSWIDENVVDVIANKFGNLKGKLSRSIIDKMAAIVFVLRQSVEWIYMTDRISPVPYRSLMRPVNKKLNTGLVYPGDDPVFEPCSHFVDPATWRGHGNVAGQGRFNIKTVSSHSIYHIIDSCLQTSNDLTPQQKVVDERAPIPHVMADTYAPTDFKNVLVPKANAWALVAGLLSSQSNFNSIKPNMMVQRILWETNSTIGFIPAISSFSGTGTSTTTLLKNKMTAIEPTFSNQLLEWTCEASLSVPICLEQVVSKFESNSEIVQLVKVWVYLLNEFKYQSNTRTPFSKQQSLEKQTGTKVYFTPARTFKVNGISNIPNPFIPICSTPQNKYLTVIPHEHSITNIAFIIILNAGHLVVNIPLLNHVYGRHFKNIIYCSDSMELFEKNYRNKFPNDPVTFAEVRVNKGYEGQNCVSESMKMMYEVDGYLQASDDVLINAWNFENLPFQQPWFQARVRVCNVDNPTVPDIWTDKSWYPWGLAEGHIASVSVFKDLDNMKSHPTEGYRVTQFMENIRNITRCDRCLLYEASDIFYVPSYLASDFTFFTEIFSRNRIFLEIAVPTILFGITSPHPIFRLFGNYLWHADVVRYPYVYQKYDHFLHTWKFSKLNNDPNSRQYFCTKFLSLVDDHLMTRPHHLI